MTNRHGQDSGKSTKGARVTRTSILKLLVSDCSKIHFKWLGPKKRDWKHEENSIYYRNTLADRGKEVNGMSKNKSYWSKKSWLIS